MHYPLFLVPRCCARLRAQFNPWEPLRTGGQVPERPAPPPFPRGTHAFHPLAALLCPEPPCAARSRGQSGLRRRGGCCRGRRSRRHACVTSLTVWVCCRQPLRCPLLPPSVPMLENNVPMGPGTALNKPAIRIALDWQDGAAVAVSKTHPVPSTYRSYRGRTCHSKRMRTVRGAVQEIS